MNASALSDRRLKKDIKDLNEYGLSEVMKLQPRRYLMMESAASDIGLIAQELKAVVPEIVYGDEKNGLLSVDYSKISLVLINAIKEQQKMIEKQGQDIEQLKTEIKNLKIKKTNAAFKIDFSAYKNDSGRIL
ncbi:tail fiber domain-containing protein [Chryseobacterium wanjuense]